MKISPDQSSSAKSELKLWDLNLFWNVGPTKSDCADFSMTEVAQTSFATKLSKADLDTTAQSSNVAELLSAPLQIALDESFRSTQKIHCNETTTDIEKKGNLPMIDFQKSSP